MHDHPIPERTTGVLHLGSQTRLSLPGRAGGDPFEAVLPHTGSVLHWFVVHFADSDRSEAVAEGASVFQIMDEKAAALPPACDGLICVPSRWGAGTDGEFSPAGGAFLGLRIDHGRYHLYRAILEGSAFEVRRLLEAAAGEGFNVDALRVEGAGARSRLWLQIHADICGLTIEGEHQMRPDPARWGMYAQAYIRYLDALGA